MDIKITVNTLLNPSQTQTSLAQLKGLGIFKTPQHPVRLNKPTVFFVKATEEQITELQKIKLVTVTKVK